MRRAVREAAGAEGRRLAALVRLARIRRADVCTIADFATVARTIKRLATQRADGPHLLRLVGGAVERCAPPTVVRCVPLTDDLVVTQPCQASTSYYDVASFARNGVAAFICGARSHLQLCVDVVIPERMAQLQQSRRLQQLPNMGRPVCDGGRCCLHKLALLQNTCCQRQGEAAVWEFHQSAMVVWSCNRSGLVDMC